MRFVQDYLELLMKPREHMKKRAGKNNVGQAFFCYLVIMAFSVLAFALESSQGVSRFLNMGQFETIAIFAMAGFAGGLLLNFAIPHFIARALGGKGNFADLFCFVIEYQTPLFFMPLLALVPCVGWLISLAYLAGWLWIEYHVFEQIYKLSLKRSIAVILASLLLSVLLGLVIGAVFVLVFVNSALSPSAAGAALITQTAAGYHYYSPHQGGYSLDYPSGMKLVDFASMMGNNTAGKLLGAAVSNDQFGMVMLTDKNGGSGPAFLMFMPDLGSNEADLSDASTCTDDLMDEFSSRQGVRYDLSGARAAQKRLGNNEACVIENVKKRGSSEASILVAANCGPKNGFMGFGPQKDKKALEQIASSVFCGQNAKK